MPNSPRDLAIFSGVPAFAEKVHVGRPNVPDRDRLLKDFGDILDRRWLSNRGPAVEEFERRITEVTGANHAVAMCNATIALEIAARACGLAGEVIVPSFTFVATAHILEWLGIRPVFCDIDPKTHNIDPARVEELITPRTSGIIGVHLWGRPCDVESLTAIADRHRLSLLFDAAHAFGCSHRGTMIGNFGRAEVFSFHATKFLNSAEGGAVVTNDGELAQRMRLMSNFGFAGYDNVVMLGTNGKMNEFSAALGCAGIDAMPQWIATNKRHHQHYVSRLGAIAGVEVAQYSDRETSNYQYVVAEIDQSATGLSRDDLVDVLWAENVLARRYFYPGCHRMEPYRTKYPDAGNALRETERLCDRVIALPTGSGVDDAAVDAICDIIEAAVSRSRDVVAQLRSRSGPAR